jgi:hypothetical protein
MKDTIRKLYVIPGLGESTRMKNYRELIAFARAYGFSVVSVAIDWSDKMDMTDYIRQAENQIPNDISEDYILGFSFGAYISAILSKKKRAKGYLFCSISPYFKENIKDIPLESKDYFGPAFIKSLKKYSFPKNEEGRAWFFVGKKDWKLAIDTAKESRTKWEGRSALCLIPDAGHELSHPNYIKKLKEVIKTL